MLPCVNLSRPLYARTRLILLMPLSKLICRNSYRTLDGNRKMRMKYFSMFIVQNLDEIKDNSNECSLVQPFACIPSFQSRAHSLTSHGDAYTSLSMSFQPVNMRPSEVSRKRDRIRYRNPRSYATMITSFQRSRRLRDDYQPIKLGKSNFDILYI